jgi:alginate lyase
MKCVFLIFAAVGIAETPARDALIKQADQALHLPALSVMDKKAKPPSGDKHDYMSVGPYWWPDPSKPDGLPYIRKDGEVNPSRVDDQTDNATFKRLLGAVPTLALAYRETGREEYAAYAAKLLRVWFLDPATKMNPNLNYGQAIPGILDGRGIGIIDSAGLLEVTQALPWLEKSSAWTKADQDGLKSWLAKYCEWLQTSKNGKEEAAAKNNHGTWYDVQVTALAVFTGQNDVARRIVEQAKQKRIAAQIRPDGKMPEELARTNSLSYTTMNTRAFCNLADLAAKVGVDLWHYQTEDGRGIRKAIDFLAQYADPSKDWTFEQIGGVKLSSRMDIVVLLRRAALAYKDPHYETVFAKLPPEEVQANRMQILWPAR